ncbi:MAG: DNA-binding MarR family transcriptional regulator [Patescibacteria group bacterium]|jgi:DNA-binding MarR family transcriptional regulator
MYLKDRATREIFVISVIFGVIILGITLVFFYANSNIENVLLESDPTTQILNTMLLNIHRDNRVVLDYLSTKDIDETVKFDAVLQKSSIESNAIAAEMQELIVSKRIVSETSIGYYQVALDLQNNAELVRNELLSLHREELVLSNGFTGDKAAMTQRHNQVYTETATWLTESITDIYLGNSLLQEKLISRVRSYFIIIALISLIFFIVVLRKIRLLVISIVTPIDETISKTRDFLSGDHQSRIDVNSDISEVALMQKNINSVFNAIEEIGVVSSVESPGRDLLNSDSLAILDFIMSENTAHRKVTITGLKRHLEVTHPTILSRLKQLELQKFISIEKIGRDKFIHITESAKQRFSS